MAAQTVKVVAFLGSTRSGRNVERVAEFVKQVIKSQGLSIDFHVVDPVELPFESLKVPLHWMPKQEDAPQWMRDTNELIKSADALLVLASEYNCTIPPAFTNMVDHFPPASFRHKPVATINYSLGQWGGIRGQLALFPILNELGCVILPSNMTIPKVTEAIAADGTCKDEQLNARMAKVLKQLHWYALAIKGQNNNGAVPEQ